MKENSKISFKNKDVTESIFFMILGLALFFYGMANHYAVDTSWALSPYLFPVLISVFLICLSVSLFLEGRKGSEEIKSAGFLSKRMRRVFAVMILSLLYYFILPLISFVPSTIIYLVLLLLLLEERRWYVIASVSFISAFSVEFIFGRLLGVLLP